MATYKVVLDSVLMAGNTIKSLDEMRIDFEALMKNIKFVSFFKNEKPGQIMVYSKLNLVLKENDGWNIADYMGKSLLMDSNYPEVWVQTDESGQVVQKMADELNRKRHDQMDDEFDFSMESENKNVSGVSVGLKMQIMYNHSENSQLVKMVKDKVNAVTKDNDCLLYTSPSPRDS